MRIALVHMRQAATGGTERYMNGLAAELAQRGDEVVIVCRSHEQAPHPRVKFERVRPLALGAAQRMWSFARAVEKHVRLSRYDLVVGLGKTWTHDVVRLGGGCHASYLEHAHAETRSPLERTLRLPEPKQAIALAIERRALAPGAYRLAICNSDMVRRDLLARYGGDPARVEVVHNGVDLTRFAPTRRATDGAAVRAELGLADADPLVLFVGSGFGRKGLDLLLQATVALRAVAPRARVLVVGGDAQRPHYERMASELGVADAVVFTGERRDVERYHAAADLFCLPTRYDAFANATLEALASGVPVVTSDANGAAEVVDANCGSVVRAGSAPELAHELVAWLPAERRAAAAKAARTSAASRSVAAMAARTRELFDRVAEEKRKQPTSAPALRR
ncbi:MAG: glycosyltransferase family 1 protein [Planctomycetota bacterium]|nr:MAG: glycosyltransferase family 1 protein [Planctomycetota bacterium]